MLQAVLYTVCHYVRYAAAPVSDGAAKRACICWEGCSPCPVRNTSHPPPSYYTMAHHLVSSFPSCLFEARQRGVLAVYLCCVVLWGRPETNLTCRPIVVFSEVDGSSRLHGGEQRNTMKGSVRGQAGPARPSLCCCCYH